MAYDHKRLKDSAYLGSSAAALVTNASGKKTYVRLITLHNTHSAALTVTLYRVPDSAGSAGSASADNQIYKKALDADQTVLLEFSAPGLLLEDTNDTIQGLCGTADKVVCCIDGAEE